MEGTLYSLFFTRILLSCFFNSRIENPLFNVIRVLQVFTGTEEDDASSIVSLQCRIFHAKRSRLTLSSIFPTLNSSTFVDGQGVTEMSH